MTLFLFEGIFFLQIHNGADENSPLLRVVTGRTIPDTTISTTSRMFVKFVAQCDVSSEGFQAKWSGTLTSAHTSNTALTHLLYNSLMIVTKLMCVLIYKLT